MLAYLFIGVPHDPCMIHLLLVISEMFSCVYFPMQVYKDAPEWDGERIYKAQLVDLAIRMQGTGHPPVDLTDFYENKHLLMYRDRPSRSHVYLCQRDVVATVYLFFL